MKTKHRSLSSTTQSTIDFDGIKKSLQVNSEFPLFVESCYAQDDLSATFDMQALVAIEFRRSKTWKDGEKKDFSLA